MDSMHRATKLFDNEAYPTCGDGDLDIMGMFPTFEYDRISMEMEHKRFILDDEVPVDLSQVISIHNEFLPHGFWTLIMGDEE